MSSPIHHSAKLLVMITLGVCDTDTPLNRVLFRICLDYVLPEDIQACCNFFVLFHERGIYGYTLESVILMQFFFLYFHFQFSFPYHISTESIVTAFNILESVMRNTNRDVYRVIFFYVRTCHVNNVWANIHFREFLHYLFPREVNRIIQLFSVSTAMHLNNEYVFRYMDIS